MDNHTDEHMETTDVANVKTSDVKRNTDEDFISKERSKQKNENESLFEGQTDDEKFHGIDETDSLCKHHNSSLSIDLDVERDAGEDETDTLCKHHNSSLSIDLDVERDADEDETDSLCKYQSDDMERDAGEDEPDSFGTHHSSSLSLDLSKTDASQLSEDAGGKENYTRVWVKRDSDEQKNMNTYNMTGGQYKYRNNNIESFQRIQSSPQKTKFSRPYTNQIKEAQSCDWCWKFRWYFAFLTLVVMMVIALCLVGLIILNHHDDLKLDNKDLLKTLRSELQEHKKQLEKMDEKYKNVQTDVDHLSSYVHRLEGKVKTNTANLSVLTSRVKDHEERMKIIDEKYEKLQIQVHILSTNVQSLNDIVQTNTANITELMNVTKQQHLKLSDQQAIITGLTNKTVELESDIIKIQKEDVEQDARQAQDIQRLQSRIELNDRKATDMSNKINEIGGTLQKLQQNEDKQSRDLSGLQGEVSQIKSGMRGISDSVNNLKWQVQNSGNPNEGTNQQRNGCQILNASTTLFVGVICIESLKRIML